MNDEDLDTLDEIFDLLRFWGHRPHLQESDVNLYKRVLVDYHNTLKYIAEHGHYEPSEDGNDATWVPSRTALIAKKTLEGRG